MRILPKWIEKWPVFLAMTLAGVLMIAGCGGTTATSSNVTATPAFSPGGGTYNASQAVTISDATTGAVLYCTTDGTTPTTSSPQCAQPTTVFKTEFLQAIAVAPGKTASAVAAAGYTIDLNAAATPTFSPAGGTYASSQTVTIADATSGANIYYCATAGCTPTSSSTLYTGPITVSQSETLSAIATVSGYNNSGVASSTYTINLTPAPTPVISPNGGAVASGQQVTIADSASTATIYYTTNGTTPSATNGTQYLTPITVTSPETIEAVAVETGYPNSTVASAAFTLLAQAATPSFRPAAGTVPSGQQVTISSSTGTTIYYAIGTTPTTSSLLYTGPVTVTSAETINAIAVGSAYSPSNIGSAAYTILPAPVVIGISPAGGTTAGGISVAINGSGFTGATAVQFGSTPATSFTVNSASSITAVSPAGSAGAVDIEVVTPGGTSATSSADRFTYAVPTPTVSGVSPASGPAAGGTSVTVTGTNFTGATAVNFGNIEVASFTVNSATSITAVSPAGSGTVDIKVVTPSGTSATVNADQFTYISAPTVTGIGVATGTTAGGTSVTITGTNFTGATAVNFGSTPATSFTVNSATNITAVSPAESAATVDIRVVTPGGTSPASAADQFTYAVPTPTVTGISPTVGPTAGGTSVTITGSNFTGATAVNFGSTTATSFTVNSATKVTAVSPAGSVGAVDIRVITPSGTSAIITADQFTYASGPAVGTIGPASGPITGGTSVAITGANFTGATAVNFGSTAATSFTVNSATSITAVSPAGSGTVDIRIVTPTGGTSTTVSADQFTYAPVPAVTGISLSSGSTAGGASVAITGTGFSGTNFTTTAINFGSTAATSFTVNSATSITAVSPAGSAGTVDITVVTPGGTNLTNAADRFTYVIPVPTVTNVNPPSGSTLGGTSVGITGTNLSGATAVSFGSIAAASFTVNSGTSMVAVSPAGSVGTVDIKVVTPSGTSATGSGDQFTYTPVPTVTGISPAFGVATGGTTVTITGTNFTGATGVNFGTTAAASFTFNSATSITAVSPAGSNGTVDITVVTPSATSATGSADQFTYGPIISGQVVSGSTAISGATVQLYAAGTTGYASAPTTADLNIVGNLTTDANGNFAMSYTCPDATTSGGDLLYLVATKDIAGDGSNKVRLMTALGSCNDSTNTAKWSPSVTVNEATTIASAYALSAFAKVDTTNGGIDVGAPAMYDATTAPGCRAATLPTPSWQSTGKETCNYNGLKNAFVAANNLVNIGTGAARTYTPDYTQSLASDTGIVNNSTVPTARINALADMLATCVESSSGSGCSGGSGLFSASTATSATPPNNTAPTDTLQAALNIAQNPGSNGISVSTLLSLVPATNQPYPTTYLVLSGTGAPTDLTLALTFTGAGLGIKTGAGPVIGGSPAVVVNEDMAIDSTGNIWVVGHLPPLTAGGTPLLLAEFSNAGKPLTAPTNLTTTPVVVGGYQPGSDWDLVLPYSPNYVFAEMDIDPSGNLWVGTETADTYDLAELSTNPLGVLQPGLQTSAVVTNVAIDGAGNVWAGGSSNAGQGMDEYSNSGNRLSPSTGWTGKNHGINNAGVYTPRPFLFDAHSNLWDEDFDGGGDLNLISTASDATKGTIIFDPYGYGFNVYDNTPASYSPVVADASGNVLGCQSDSLHLDVNNANNTYTVATSPDAVPTQYSIPTTRGCGSKMAIDGLGHIFAVTGGTPPGIIDEFSIVGVLPGDPASPNPVTVISPATGYSGTSRGEAPAINPDPNAVANFGNYPPPTLDLAAAGLDGSGNLWVLNPDTGTNGGSTFGNVLVEYVGMGAPVVTPPSLSLKNGNLGVRP